MAMLSIEDAFGYYVMSGHCCATPGFMARLMETRHIGAVFTIGRLLQKVYNAII